MIRTTLAPKKKKKKIIHKAEIPSGGKAIFVNTLGFWILEREVYVLFNIFLRFTEIPF